MTTRPLQEPTQGAARTRVETQLSAGRLAGRRLLIVGGGGRIGAAAATRAAGEGAAVAIADLDGAAAAAVASGLGSPSYTLDATREDDVAACVEQATNALGGLDGLFTTAGVLVAKNLDDLDIETWTRSFHVNVTGAFLLAKHAAAAMRRSGRDRGASIVLTSSTAGIVGASGRAAYNTAKTAIIGLTRALADELAPAIRVNCICPGWVDTPFNDPVWTLAGGRAGNEDALVRSVPLQRQATADEIAPAVTFLLSDDASYLTGSQLVVDGGVTATRR